MKLIKKYKDENKLDELEKEYAEKLNGGGGIKYGAGSVNSKLLRDSENVKLLKNFSLF